MPGKRVAFVIDGFNLYHSLKQAVRQHRLRTRWLDLVGVCSAYLHLVGGGAQLQGVYYFSAYATHIEARSPGVVQRHKDYVDALLSTGVHVELGTFKRKDTWCPICGGHFDRHEEKETDVAVSAKLIELAVTDAADAVVLISGDTDILPAIKLVQRLKPAVEIWIAFPHDKHNNVLETQVGRGRYFKIKPSQYVAHQLPDPVTLADGRVLAKPVNW